MIDIRKLLRLHVIAKSVQQDGRLVSTTIPGEFESGRWTATEAFADQAVDAELHLHQGQKERSWKAGTIISWRASDIEGRVVYRFRLDPMLSAVQRKNWGNEQARVWDEGGNGAMPSNP